MSVYESGKPAVNNGHLTQSELHLYGSSRLGLLRRNLDVAYEPEPGSDPSKITMPLLGTGDSLTFVRGDKLFELSNHLGNVLVTVSDKKLGVSLNNNTVDYFNPQVVSAQDYYPFGMLQPGRSYNAGGYRFGFNGKENHNEVKGVGNQQDYGMRISDPRIGRFLSVDPITKEYPELTPYQFARNRPIDGIDQDGLEWELSTVNNRLRQQATWLLTPRFNNGTISAYDPNKKAWTEKWRDSKNVLANITYEISNGLYTLPQQLTASVRNAEHITNIGGNVHRAHGIEGEKQRVKSFVDGATTLVPGSEASKVEGLVAKYADNVLTKIESQVTEHVTKVGLSFDEGVLENFSKHAFAGGRHADLGLTVETMALKGLDLIN